MKLFDTIWRSHFLIKLRSWEYWPFNLVYAPVFFYWLWLALKARSLLYFTASNPAIENGGMLGESKIKILDTIPEQYKPTTILFKPSDSIELILEKIKSHTISYPLICKPDIGERGWMVKKIENDQDLETYLQAVNVDFLVQEYLDLPIEMGVFYYRYPGQAKGTVSSIVIKEMLTITGNGKSTLRTLILKTDRAKLQWHTLKKKHSSQLDEVIPADKSVELVAIGNHSLGTKFLNGNHLINDKLCEKFDSISKQVKEFYFGRFDIRIASIDDLYSGSVKIMELNGAGSEPGHIYEPGFSLWKAYKVIFHHWKVLYEISVINHQNGVDYLTLSEGWKEFKKIRNKDFQ